MHAGRRRFGFRRASLVVVSAVLLSGRGAPKGQDTPLQLPLAQGTPGGKLEPLTLRDASRDDRWLGLGVRDVRWDLVGKTVYFRWNGSPRPADDPEADPWFRVSSDGQQVEEVKDADLSEIPAAEPSWSLDGRLAAWNSEGRVYLFEAGKKAIERVYATEEPVRNVRLRPDGSSIHWMQGEDLFEYAVGQHSLRQLTRRFVAPSQGTAAAAWLAKQQEELFEVLRDQKNRREVQAEGKRRRFPAPQAIPVAGTERLENIQLSPDGRYLTFVARTPAAQRQPTKYLDYVSDTGYARPVDARPKVGEPQDTYRMGIVRFDPAADPEKTEVVWVRSEEAGAQPAVFLGPFWSLDGSRCVIQILSQRHKDLWISELDPATGTTRVLVHDHDDAWLGGPPPVAGSLEPALLEWLPGGSFVFASERSGWSHLYLADADGNLRPLTGGPWEVRGARLSRDRSRWLLSTSREDPCVDHLYTLPAAGGELVRLTTAPGRNEGYLAPDGTGLAVVRSDSVHLPDLFLTRIGSSAPQIRITVSGADPFYQHRWIQPEVVSFLHQDGKPLWAALYRPQPQRKNGAAILHIHGGGYRQFSHRGWSVYGYGLHLGLLHYLVQEGYTVLDFDYRGSAGFGRDYRTDIYRSMGEKDVLGALAAVDYLVDRQGIDRKRIGIYGISYGGFFTLMALFRHPGVFAAGIANASVSDWAHYNHPWTSRILNLPFEDPEAYNKSSPIYFASGLRDPLLIVHGLIDDNVHFQDTARLVQKLIEEEKSFEVMFYPVERHTIRTESSRYDYVRRVADFFRFHLTRP